MKNDKFENRWTDQDLQKLKTFITSEKTSYYTHFYRNILNPVNYSRRESGINIRMAESVSKTVSQCKSKIQKMEQTINKDFLNIPDNHLQVYDKVKFKKRQIKQKEIIFKKSHKRKENFNAFNSKERESALKTNIKKPLTEPRKPYPKISISQINFDKCNPKYRNIFHWKCTCLLNQKMPRIEESKGESVKVKNTSVSERSVGEFDHEIGTTVILPFYMNLLVFMFHFVSAFHFFFVI
jgi:hypothetical protein